MHGGIAVGADVRRRETSSRATCPAAGAAIAGAGTAQAPGVQIGQMCDPEGPDW